MVESFENDGKAVNAKTREGRVLFLTDPKLFKRQFHAGHHIFAGKLFALETQPILYTPAF